MANQPGPMRQQWRNYGTALSEENDSDDALGIASVHADYAGRTVFRSDDVSQRESLDVDPGTARR
jgi:hypothetical protein